MSRERMPSRGRLIGMIALLVAALALLIFLIVISSRGRTEKKEQAAAISAGVEYLQSLEARGTSEVEATLKAMRQAELAAQCEQRKQQLLNGELDVWSQFEDYVLLGDSRAVGFYYYKFLPENRVLAAGGATIRDVQKHIEQIKALNPASVFLCYGLNDVSIGFWHTPEDYAAEYKQVVDSVKEAVPGVTVYVSSILPARDPAFERSSSWREIPNYSAAVSEMCRENGIPFVDNDAISEAYSELWEADGIHLRREFYPYWGINLIMSVYENQESQ